MPTTRGELPLPPPFDEEPEQAARTSMPAAASMAGARPRPLRPTSNLFIALPPPSPRRTVDGLWTILCTIQVTSRGEPVPVQPRGDGALAVYRELREAIVSARFQPNERLGEADLARTLGAGRTTIRAALVRLDQEGPGQRTPNRRARGRLVSDREAPEIEAVRSALAPL